MLTRFLYYLDFSQCMYHAIGIYLFATIPFNGGHHTSNTMTSLDTHTDMHAGAIADFLR